MLKSIFILILTFSLSSQALTLDEARSNNVVTEMPTGYIKANNQDPPTKALVEKINSERKKVYEDLAKKNGLPVDQVAAQAAKKIKERLGK